MTIAKRTGSSWGVSNAMSSLNKERIKLSLEKVEFNKFVEDVFRQEYMRIVTPKKYSEFDFNAYMEKHLFFVTMTFNMAFSSNPHNAKRCMDSFRGIYVGLIKSLLGSHYSRKLPLQPLTFYCVDNENSRYGIVDLVHGKNLHVHALMLLHPQTMKSWELVDHGKLRASNSTIDRLSFSPYDPAQGSIMNLVSYVSKATKIFDQGINQDFLPKNLTQKISGMENWNTKAANSNLHVTLVHGSQVQSNMRMKGIKSQNHFADFVQDSRKMHYRKLKQRAPRNRFKKKK